jgi:hypothetical protein
MIFRITLHSYSPIPRILEFTIASLHPGEVYAGPVRHGVSQGVEDGCKPPALLGRFGGGPPAGHRRVGHNWPG